MIATCALIPNPLNYANSSAAESFVGCSISDATNAHDMDVLRGIVRLAQDGVQWTDVHAIESTRHAMRCDARSTAVVVQVTHT